MKRSKKVELNLKVEIGRLVLFTIISSRKRFGITWSGRRDRNNHITSIYPIPVGKSTSKGEKKIVPSHFLSHPGAHINTKGLPEKRYCQSFRTY